MLRLIVWGWAVMLLLICCAMQAGIWLRSPLLSFVANPDGVQDVFLLDSRSGVVHNLTGNRGDIWTFSWSADGERLLFGSSDPQLIAGESAFVLDWRTNQLQTIQTGTVLRVFGLGFAEDAEHVVFFSSHPRNISDLYRSSLRDGTIRNLTATPDASEENPLWSPTGTHLLFNMRTDLYLLDFRSGVRLRLTESVVLEEHPVWSPDGRTITFQRVEGMPQRRNQYILGLDGSEQRVQLDHDLRAGAASWSPDSSSLTLATARNEIIIVDLESATSRMIATNGYAPAWSPDGQTIAYLSQRRVMLVDVRGGEPYLLNASLPVLPPLIPVR